jgi:sensor histidine kinase YesM
MSDTQIEIIGAFRQFDRDKFEQQGLGLGLVSVKLIADIYCGDLDIRRRPEGGTLVTFRAPMAH